MSTVAAAEQPGAGRLLRPPRDLVLAVAVVSLLALVMTAPPVFDAGRYYDDWALLAAMQDGKPGWAGAFEACRDIDPAGRPGGCFYHATAYWLFGDTIKPYHALSTALLALSALLLHLVLVRMRLPYWAALLSAALYVVYPGSDATRLWVIAFANQYVLVLYLGALLITIAALRRRGAAALALHAVALALYVVLLYTYEVVVPMLALAGLFCWLAVRSRAAIVRGLVDLGLALAFVAWRLVIDPVKESSGFVVERTAGETVERAADVVRGAWTSWHTLFVPSALALIVALAAAVAVVAVVVARPQARRPVALWLARAALAAGVAIAAVLAYTTANDFYIPQTGGTFNRLNLMAAPAYCVAFACLAGAVWQALQLPLGRRAAAATVGVAVVGVALFQVGVARDSQAAWKESWRAQGQALNALRVTMRGLPADTSVVTFGHPLYEPGWVPVFAGSWDLRGAIDVETGVDPPRAVPFLPAAACGPDAVMLDGEPYMPYRGESPLWFVNTVTFERREIRSAADCRLAERDWGRPPLFGALSEG